MDGLGALIQQYPAWGHFIIGIAILIQGELGVFLGTFLIAQGSFGWIDYITGALITIFIAESLVFFFGRFMRTTRFGWRIYRNKIKPNKKYQPYFYYLRTNLTKLFVSARFLVGVNFFVLFLSGWSKTKYGKFLKSYIIGLLSWFIPMTIVAYFFMSGLSYLKHEKIFKQAEYGIILLLLIFFGVEFLVKKYMKKKSPFGGKEDVSGFLDEEDEKK
ncbi:hypothetical protein C4565_04620 [Candidatus Parcubacteria bacterium]|nr:MAG: hypothetical protein C4565_04620 [Candidatus Parcubacteria bacterium]